MTEEELCLLSKVRKEDVFHEPFPHIIIHNPLDGDLVSALIARHPTISTIIKGKPLGSNKRFDFTIKDIGEDSSVDTLWSSFIRAQAGSLFLSKLATIFMEDLNRLYPQKFNSVTEENNLRVGTRYLDTLDDKDILLDAHISINSPVTDKPDSVRSGHVDDPRKLYSGLFYMRRDDDDSKGGDLELYQYKKKKFKMHGQGVDDKYLKIVKTIPYEKNVLVLFLNSIESLHGVTIREKTSHSRYFVNLIGELKEPLFDIKKYQEGFFSRKFRSIKKNILI